MISGAWITTGGMQRRCDEARRGGGAGVHDSSRLENQGVLYRDRALGLRAEQGAARRSQGQSTHTMTTLFLQIEPVFSNNIKLYGKRCMKGNVRIKQKLNKVK